MSLLLALLIIHLPIASKSEEKNKNSSAELDLTFNSKYIWRGINISDEFVFQPSLTTSYKWFSIGIWGSTEGGEYAVDFTEVDYTLDLSFELGKLGISTGAVYYTFPNTDFDATTEIYGALSLDVLLSPSLTLFYDVELAHGVYANLSLGHSFENIWKLSDFTSLSVETALTAGWGTKEHNEFYYGFDRPAFTDAAALLTLPLKVKEAFVLTPYVSYTFLLDGGIRNRMENDDNLWYGLSLAYKI